MEVDGFDQLTDVQTENTAAFSVGKDKFVIHIPIEKGRGLNVSSNGEENKRYEGRAGRYEKLDISGTGPCPCIVLIKCIRFSN